MSGRPYSPEKAAALQRRLEGALQWRSDVDASRVTVAVDLSGAVTIEGSVRTYAERCAVEDAVRCAPGVGAVRNHAEVRLTIGDYRTDAALERVLSDLFDFLARMPPERPRASVANGWVTLEGTVQWPHQKRLIERAVREIAGVKGITNRLVVPRTARSSAATS